MSNLHPSHNFENAAAYLSSAPSLAKVSNVVKLELYGLYKYLTSSALPATSRPSIFDMTGRAKWDAWNAAGQKYKLPQDAEARYLEIARSLGWTEAAEIPQTREPDGVDIWDDDSEASDSGKGGGGGGMGLAVSSMQRPPVVLDQSMHGLALSNDVDGLIALLDRSKDTNLDSLDDYGYTPLHLACDRGNTGIVKVLLERGASRDIKDPDNLSPLELAQEAGRIDIVVLLATPD